MAVDFPISEAMDDLTGFEIIAVRKAFGASIANLPEEDVLFAFVWAFEKRERPDVTPDEIRGWKMRAVREYFADEPVEVDVEGK